MRKKIFRAGLIPYYINSHDNSINMLFMQPSDPKFGGGDKFQCCKGKIEEGETELEAAKREAQEEVGLFVPNLKDEPHNLGVFLGRTTIFIAEIKDKDMFGDHDSETAETKWMSPEEFNKSGRDLHRPIVKAAKRWITKHHDMVNGNEK